MDRPAYCQVVTTTDSRSAADELARTAVEARLAACAQVVGPISSSATVIPVSRGLRGSPENRRPWI